MARTRSLRNANTIEYPIYRLKGEPIVVDRIMFVAGLPIDDLRVKKATLGARRLHSSIEMSNPGAICWSFADLIRSLKGQENWFIDRAGDTFKYVKTQSVMLKTHKIKGIQLMETHSLIVLDGIDTPFLQPRPSQAKYARVIYYKGYPLEILEFTNSFLKPGSKKV